MKPQSKFMKFAMGAFVMGMAMVQPFDAVPVTPVLSTVITAEAASTVKLNKSKLSLNIKKSYQLKLTDTSRKVTWSSSRKAVATVSKAGKVTAKKKGTTTITAKVGSKKYTCKVTVTQPVTSVKLNTTTATLTKAGETITLKATAAPTSASSKAVTWTSSDTAVATVTSKGVVTAVGSGTCTITASAKDGSKKSASCKVTVNIPDANNQTAASQTVLVSSVSLNETETLLTTMGQTLQLTAAVAPSNASNKNITWESTFPKVATVDDNGKVTAIRSGYTYIYARSSDGSNKIATCYVKVEIPEAPEVITVQFIDIDFDGDDYLTTKGETVQLKPVFYPSDATDKTVTYTSSDTSIVTVDSNGLVTAVGNGIGYITVRSNDEDHAECTIAFKVAIP